MALSKGRAVAAPSEDQSSSHMNSCTVQDSIYLFIYLFQIAACRTGQAKDRFAEYE